MSGDIYPTEDHTIATVSDRIIATVSDDINLVTMANSVALGVSVIENLIGVDLSKDRELDVCHHMAALLCIELNKRQMAIIDSQSAVSL